LQHVIGHPQTYTVSPIWNSSEENGGFSSCPDGPHPIKRVATTMAIINFFMDYPDRCLDAARNRFDPVEIEGSAAANHHSFCYREAIICGIVSWGGARAFNGVRKMAAYARSSSNKERYDVIRV